MEEKLKYISIGLAVLLAASIFGIVYTQGLKKTVERERDLLAAENSSLNKKIIETQQKISALQGEVDKISQEKKDVEDQKNTLKKRCDLLAKQKEELEGKIKAGQAGGGTSDKSVTGQLASSLSEDSYWTSVLRKKVELESELQKTRAELKQAQINNDQLSREKTAAESELKGVLHDREDFEQQLVYNQKTLDSLAAELVREKNSKRSSQDGNRFLKNENIILKQQVKSLSVYKSNLEKKVASLQEDKAGFARKFNEMSVLLEDKYSQIGELKEKVQAVRDNVYGQSLTQQAEPVQEKKGSIELPPIVVHAQSEAVERYNQALEAKVAAINKENNFIIIDIGESSGIVVGQGLSVYEGSKPIADINVIEVRRDISACDIKKQTSPIKVGDVVK